MNKKGALMIGVATAFILMIAGFMFINFVKDDVAIVRDADNLNCANATAISDGNKVSCLFADVSIPYLFVIILSVIGGSISARISG